MPGGTDASQYKKTGILDALFGGTEKLQISLVSLLGLRTQKAIFGPTQVSLRALREEMTDKEEEKKTQLIGTIQTSNFSCTELDTC